MLSSVSLAHKVFNTNYYWYTHAKVSLVYTTLNLTELLTSFASLELTSCWWRPLLELIKEPWTFLYTLGDVTVGWCKKPQISFALDADTIHITVGTISSTRCNETWTQALLQFWDSFLASHVKKLGLSRFKRQSEISIWMTGDMSKSFFSILDSFRCAQKTAPHSLS